MENFVTTMVEGLSASALWGAIGPAAPLIISMALFALGYRVVKKNVRAGQKGRGGRV